MPLIYHLATAADWTKAQSRGLYQGGGQDKKDGFIHFSTADRLAETAARYFAGRRDVVLIAAAAEDLDDALRWEASRDGIAFPHLHAALEVERVRWARPVGLSADGQLNLPIGN